jgi:hypothetical protein
VSRELRAAQTKNMLLAMARGDEDGTEIFKRIYKQVAA